MYKMFRDIGAGVNDAMGQGKFRGTDMRGFAHLAVSPTR